MSVNFAPFAPAWNAVKNTVTAAPVASAILGTGALATSAAAARVMPKRPFGFATTADHNSILQSVMLNAQKQAADVKKQIFAASVLTGGTTFLATKAGAIKNYIQNAFTSDAKQVAKKSWGRK